MAIGPIIGAGISAISSLLGGSMASRATQDANAANLQFAREQAHEQSELARAGIRMKVHDAKMAGIHPLYALGAPSMGGGAVAFNAQADTSMGSALSSAGQSIGRAVAATQSPSQRAGGVAIAQSALQIERDSLENELLRTRIASERAKLAQVGPPIPSFDNSNVMPGQGDSGVVDTFDNRFPVPEKSKSEERPPLMIFGRRWGTNPNTSPMKAWEDQYGDEGPVAWTMPMVVGANDAIYNAQHWLRGTSLARYMREMQRAVQSRYGRR